MNKKSLRHKKVSQLSDKAWRQLFLEKNILELKHKISQLRFRFKEFEITERNKLNTGFLISLLILDELLKSS